MPAAVGDKAQRKLDAVKAKTEAYEWLQQFVAVGRLTKTEAREWQERLTVCRSLADALGIKEVLIAITNAKKHPLEARIEQLEHEKAELEQALQILKVALDTVKARG